MELWLGGARARLGLALDCSRQTLATRENPLGSVTAQPLPRCDVSVCQRARAIRRKVPVRAPSRKRIGNAQREGPTFIAGSCGRRYVTVSVAAGLSGMGLTTKGRLAGGH
jgi:hypothetical protein